MSLWQGRIDFWNRFGHGIGTKDGGGFEPVLLLNDRSGLDFRDENVSCGCAVSLFGSEDDDGIVDGRCEVDKTHIGDRVQHGLGRLDGPVKAMRQRGLNLIFQ